MTGTVLFGINNIYTVRVDEPAGGGSASDPSVAGTADPRTVMCRIKGKVLRNSVDEYNPIAVGDRVELEEDRSMNGSALITGRLPRTSEFARWNKKREAPQTIAANIDTVVCVTSPVSPPFRPRFVDRVLVMAHRGGVKPVILLNKIDQDVTEDVAARLAYYEDMGYELLFSSASNGKGLGSLKKRLSGRIAAFVGQSGAGKTTLLNALFPGIDRTTGEISRKYNRGKHTTNYAVLIPEGTGGMIDTPGIREIDVYGIEPEELETYFPDVMRFRDGCEFLQCSHVHEPGCAVRSAAEEEDIHPDRYESYVRLYEHLATLDKEKYE